MVTISEIAAEKAKEILNTEGKANWGLRVYTVDGGCHKGYGMDLDERPAEGDHVIEKNGLKVFMDQQTIDSLSGMEIDYLNENGREGFILTGGQAPSCSSGCSSCG